MTITCKIAVESTFVLLTCTGTYSKKSALETFRLGFEQAVNEGKRAVVIDARNVTGNPADALERYDLGSDFADLQTRGFNTIPVAVVGNRPLVDLKQLAAVVARNRGGTARVFTRIPDAIAWIDELIA